MAPGESIDIIGPSGKGFELPPPKTEALIISGGIGIGPVLFWARTMLKAGFCVTLVAGFRNRSSIIERSLFNNVKTVICTDDGSEGFHGTTADWLESSPEAFCNAQIIYSCGPMPMLKKCVQAANRKGIECIVSVEQVMACGVGACMGCAIKASGDRGYFRVCHEGPVFNSRDLEWT
jgi:dihydroorotate dehydrogenase electron transfer subunit